MKAEYKVDLFTGIRPTAGLTIANYVGAVKPLLDLVRDGRKPLVFVADMHALTDSEPELARKYTREVVADYLALGLDPDTTIYAQSAIAKEISYLTILLSRHTTIAELLRVPALKDKLKGNARPETANLLLAMYPVMMAADILIQRAKTVPVGDDQVPHIEFARELARDFNSKYGEVFPMPQAQAMKPVRIMALKGPGKMSKSVPEGAIFLSDDPELAKKKIKTAETAMEGEMSQSLDSHITLAKALSGSTETHAEIDAIIAEHMEGRQVMGKFKTLLGDLIGDFLAVYQENKKTVMGNSSKLDTILEKGATVAKHNAEETMVLVSQTIGF